MLDEKKGKYNFCRGLSRLIGLFAKTPRCPTGSSYTMGQMALTYVLDPGGRLRLALWHEQSAQQVTDDLRTLMPAG